MYDTAFQSTAFQWDAFQEFLVDVTITIEEVDPDTNVNNVYIPLTSYLDTLANLQDGKLYTVVLYCKVDDTSLVAPYDGIKNNRVSVVNGVETFGGRVSDEGVYEKIVTTFIYDSGQDVTIKLYGNYQSVSTDDITRMAGLCINEGLNMDYGESVNLLTDPDALYSDSTPSDITIPADSSSALYKYSFPALTIVGGGSNPFFTGLSLGFNSYSTTNSGMDVYMGNDDGLNSETKSGYINHTGMITLGGMGDLWNLTDARIKDDTLDVYIIWKNPSLISQTYNYNNLTLIGYWADDKTWDILGFTYNGSHSRNYQVILEDLKNNVGTSSTSNLLKLNRSDGEFITSHDILHKEIELQLLHINYSVLDVEQVLTQLGQWLTNTRDSMNIPEPHPLIFDVNTSLSYDAVLNNEIEVTRDPPTYNIKAMFIVPDGVARSTTPKVTGHMGTNEGKVTVRPTVEVIADGSASMVLTDSISGQVLTLNETVSSNTTVIFDCSARTVTDEYGVDLSDHISVDSVWFNFVNDYHVTTTGCILQSIQFYEGY